jgi:hypothetical protein
VPYGTSPKGLSHAKLSHADLISIVEAYVKIVCIRENYFKHSSAGRSAETSKLDAIALS